MSDFEKLSFNSYLQNDGKTGQFESMRRRRRSQSGYLGKNLFKSKKFRIFLAVFAVFLILAVFFVILPAKRLYTSIKKTQAQVQLVGAALKQENISLASDYLATTKTDLEQTQQNLNAMAYLQFIPVANWYYSDGDHLVKGGFYGIDAAQTMLDAIKPNADLLGLKGKGSFVGGSAEQRISTAVAALGT